MPTSKEPPKRIHERVILDLMVFSTNLILASRDGSISSEEFSRMVESKKKEIMEASNVN